jgi:hypothetical protein
MTKKIEVTATDGTKVSVVVPTNLPSNDRAEILRKLYSDYVRELNPELGWKGPCQAIVPADMASLVAEAMNFMGSVVDKRETLPSGYVKLNSRGYYHHIGA